MQWHVAAAVLTSITLSAPAQEHAPATPRRSFADGLVRHFIEREGLKPPQVTSGLELGAGKGPMVLLVRRANGTLELLEIERGAGDHGKVPAKRVLTEEVVEEEADEKKVPEEAPAKPATAALQAPLSLQIRRQGELVSIGTADAPQLIQGARVERHALQPVMERLFARSRHSKFEGHLVLRIDGAALMQDVLTALAAAQAAGFDLVMFGNSFGVKQASIEDRELLAGLPAKYDWELEALGPGGVQKAYAGELLVLLQGAATWGDVGPLYMQCARVGIWQISFVGQKDPRTRFKLRANLPFDRGL